MMRKQDDEGDTEVTAAYQKLIATQQTLLLATVSDSAQPDISYAPYVRDEQGHFYIFISELASHTRNLLANRHASIMFIQAESESTELFARERVTLKCDATEIFPDNPIYEQQLGLFKSQFGEIVSLLKSLSDFHLFALKPESGQYVAGFGKAVKI